MENKSPDETFKHTPDDLILRILHMFEYSFSPDVAQSSFEDWTKTYQVNTSRKQAYIILTPLILTSIK